MSSYEEQMSRYRTGNRLRGGLILLSLIGAITMQGSSPVAMSSGGLEVTFPARDSIVPEDTMKIEGRSSTPSGLVKVTLDGELLGTAHATKHRWSLDLEFPPTRGEHTILVVEHRDDDLEQAEIGRKDGHKFRVGDPVDPNLVKLDPIEILSPKDQATVKEGSVEIEGRATPGSLIQIRRGASPVDAVRVSDQGVWKATVAVDEESKQFTVCYENNPDIFDQVEFQIDSQRISDPNP